MRYLIMISIILCTLSFVGCDVEATVEPADSAGEVDTQDEGSTDSGETGEDDGTTDSGETGDSGDTGDTGDSGSGETALPPEAPLGLAVAPSDGAVTLTWSAAEGAVSYSVYYGQTSDSSLAALFSGDIDTTDTTCLVDGLTNGTLYYFWIKALNDAGESPFSLVASGTPEAADMTGYWGSAVWGTSTWGP